MPPSANDCRNGTLTSSRAQNPNRHDEARDHDGVTGVVRRPLTAASCAGMPRDKARRKLVTTNNA